jgi:hypothetical protein
VERAEVEASSVFDAGYQAVERFARMWWWDYSKPITVLPGGAEWHVRPDRLSEWKSRQRGPSMNQFGWAPPSMPTPPHTALFTFLSGKSRLCP